MGKYLRRAIKYYIFLLVLITLVCVLLVLCKFADATNINTMFRNGYNAVWEIALIFLAVALIYPKLGFGNRDFTMRAGSWEAAKMNMMIAMGDRGYKLESEDGKTFTFRKKWFVTRLGKFLEDRITITVLSDIEATEAPEDQTATANQTTTNLENQTSETQTSTEENNAQKNNQITQAEETADNNGGIYSGSLNKYVVNLEGLTKDVVRIVSALYRVQNQSTAE